MIEKKVRPEAGKKNNKININKLMPNTTKLIDQRTGANSNEEFEQEQRGKEAANYYYGYIIMVIYG